MLVSEQRLVDAAAELFYRRGIAATGVDAVAAKSGVSKPTLYARFGTKAALVAAVLADHHQRRRESLTDHLADRGDLSPAERLLSVFDWIAAHQRGDWGRGCPFVNASVELVRPEDAPARQVIAAHKRWFRSVLAELAAQAGASEPARLASGLHVLIEGANARMLAEADTSAIATARDVAELLVARAHRPAGDTPLGEEQS